MNAPEISNAAAERMYRIQLEAQAQESCTCENNEDYCESCEAREELHLATQHQTDSI